MVKELIDKLTESIKEALKEANVEEFIDKIVSSKRIFVVGEGRSGLVAKAFAMRLMHLGFDVYVVGETITPSIKEGDLLIAVSGSGRTTFALSVAKTAKQLGVKIAAITSYPDSPLAKLSDCVVKVKGREEVIENYISRQLMGEHIPLTPLGTLFELSAAVLLDAVVVKLMEKLGKKEEELKRRHANL